MNKRLSLGLYSLAALSLLALPGCGSDDADADTDGKAGSCTITDKGDGTSAIVCPDGTELVVSNGKDGAPGKDGDKGDQGDKGDKGDGAEAPCALGENAEGKHTLTCGDQTVVIGDDCEDGFYGNIDLYGRGDSGSATFSLFQVTNCTWVRGNVEVDGFDGETLPKALSRIEKVDGHIKINYNDELTRLGFPALKTVGGDLYIEENAALEEIDDFASLETVGGDVHILDNGALQKIGDVSVKTLDGEWNVIRNPELVSTGNFPELETAVGWINFWDNAKLKSIGSYDKLTTVDEGIVWEDSPALVDMGAFPALETAGWLYIGGNAAMTSLPDFPSLKKLGSLYIEDNAELASVEGLGALETVDGDVTITGNAKLPQCQVEELLQSLTIAGTTKKNGNDETATCP